MFNQFAKRFENIRDMGLSQPVEPVAAVFLGQD
jgi:hypothetical protein